MFSRFLIMISLVHISYQLWNGFRIHVSPVMNTIVSTPRSRNPLLVDRPTHELAMLNEKRKKRKNGQKCRQEIQWDRFAPGKLVALLSTGRLRVTQRFLWLSI